MPKQLPILALVLCSFYWPWQFFSGDMGWLVTVITVSFACVMLCNIFCGESWVIGVMIIEWVAMFINATLFYFELHQSAIQSHMTLAGFIIEILIISMSAGGVFGRINRDNSPRHRLGIYYLRNHYISNKNSSEIAR